MSPIQAQSCSFCFLDLDFDHQRRKLATYAAFVNATDSRYGFSSPDLRLLGGSEVSRLPDLISTDHEWSNKNTECGGIIVRPPPSGNRIVVQLYWDAAPLACENFATLCQNGSRGDKGSKPSPMGESGKPLTYRNSVVHRVIPGFVLQGGDFVFGNGSGGESIYNGKKFKDERAGLARKHDQKGVLSMGNSGKNSNTSQFFITFQATPQCDGKHVVFGQVVSGFEVLDYAETFGTPDGKPSIPIHITDCGVFTPMETPGAGYWYDQPDMDAYTGVSPVFMAKPRVAILAPSRAVMERFQKSMGSHASITPLCAEDYKGDDVKAKIAHLLESFAIDVVVVAPACKDLIQSLEIPKSWVAYADNISIDEVVLTNVKPVGVLTAIWTRSWLRKQSTWHRDGPSS